MELIPLTKGKFALIDSADSFRVSGRRWHAVEKAGIWYAASRIKNKIVYMHRWLMNPPYDMEIDHIDDDGLNNTRVNLRICTGAQNKVRRRRINTSSGFRGVRSHSGHWRTIITVNGKRLYIGFFTDKTNAARAYDAAAIKYYGEFARLNFP